MPGAGPYSATKFAIRALTDALRFEVRGWGVDVVLVEPGPIRTGFTTHANTTFPEAPDYAAYHEAVAKADAETDSSRLAGDAEDVARTIRRAIEARRPRAVYRVTFVSRLLPTLRAALPERGWDAFLRTQAAAPGPPDR
jgi:short-subunit dehydrogenase